jgi:bifunctional non-homologous end joining protein LigD
VRLFTRNGHDWTGRFPLIARATLSLRAASCLIDGEAVACDDNGLPVFDRLRYRRDDGGVFLYAFDLIELDGDDLRDEPIERRRVLLIRLLAKASAGLQVNDHIVEPGDVVFRHACQLGFEGIVSKRLGSPYVSGRSRHWIKTKEPKASGGETGGRGGLGKEALAMSVAPPEDGRNRIMIYGPKPDGTYVIEFKTASSSPPLTVASPDNEPLRVYFGRVHTEQRSRAAALA